MLKSSELKVTPDQFIKMAEEEFGRLKATWAKKGVEYSGETNRLTNFIKEGLDAGVAPEIVHSIYLGKHISAIKQHAKDLNVGFERTLSEPITGRWHDIIAYGFLGLAMALAREGEFAQAPAPKFVAPPATEPVVKATNAESPPMSQEGGDRKPMTLAPEEPF